jgi:hypothetical protein
MNQDDAAIVRVTRPISKLERHLREPRIGFFTLLPGLWDNHLGTI